MTVIQFKEKMFMCVKADTSARFDTKKNTRKESIAELIEGTNFNWSQCQKFGWKCIKVEVVTTEIK